MDVTQAKAKARKILIRGTAILLALVIVGGGLYTFASLTYAYSTGERVGYVQKLSKKGWICHTNEGELAMTNIPGQPATIVPFTVPDDAVAAQIDSFAGHKVALDYKEHRGVPSSCFGDTTLFIYGVRKTD
jgi:hypothetical protein